MPAARVTDLTVTGDPIMPPGAPTVLIGNMSAARIGDPVVGAICSGAITKGSATVSISGMLAARVGDTVTGVHVVTGVPLTTAIAKGLPTVLIGG